MPLHRAKILLADRGHLLGDGVFETMRLLGGRVFQRDLHTTRLAAGLRGLGLGAKAARAAWRATDALAIAAEQRFGPDVRLRLQVTTGVGDAFEGQPGRFAVTALARAFQPPPRSGGVDLVVVDAGRPLGAPMKTTSFHPAVAARRAALAAGADDALLLNVAGRVCEATTSNVFAARDGVVHAPGPDEGALEGTTRTLVLAGLPRANVRPRLSRADLARAQEVILTNVGGIRAARSIDGRRLLGARGPVFAAIQGIYDEAIADFIARAPAPRGR